MYILFLSRRDGERSVIAASLARQMFGTAARCESAGLEAGILHPLAVETMKAINLDIAGYKPKALRDAETQGVDLVVVIDGRDLKQNLPAGVKHLHWPLVDPLDPPTGDQAELRARFLDTRIALSKHLKSLAKLHKKLANTAP